MNPDDFVKRTPKTPGRAYGGKKRMHVAAEEHLAEVLGGTRRRDSGAGQPQTTGGRRAERVSGKGDVETDELLIESKSTEKKSISIKREILEKITDEARANMARHPGLHLYFPGMPHGVAEHWVAVPLDFFKRLVDSYRQDDL